MPESRDELDRMLLPYKMLVNPLLVGASDALVGLGSKALSQQEIVGGTHAFSALMAQYFPGKFSDSRFLVAIWVLGTLMPRLLAYLQEKKKQKEAEVRAFTPDAVRAAADAERVAASSMPGAVAA